MLFNKQPRNVQVIADCLMKQNKAMSSFLSEAARMLDSMKQFSGCELYHYNMRPMLEGMERTLKYVDIYPNSVECLRRSISSLLEEEGIAEAELNAFGLPDPDDCWPEDCIDPLEYAEMTVPVTAKMGDGFKPEDIEYKIAEKLDWLDMTVEIAIPAISAIMRHYKRDDKEGILDLTSAQIFGLILSDDVPAEDWDMFTSLRGEIERDMRSGMDYRQSVLEWFK